MEKLKRSIEKKLNVKLSENKRGTIDNLNKMPLDIIEQARTLDNPLLAEFLLSFYVTSDDRRFIKFFLQEVVFENGNRDTWGLNGIIAPSISLADLLVREREHVLSYYDDFSFKSIVKPEYDIWLSGSGFVGAPIKEDSTINYKTKIPKGYAILKDSKIKTLDKNCDQNVTYRRWIASRIARYVKINEGLTSSDEIELKLQKLTLDTEWTQDSHKALSGLKREYEEGLLKENCVPGFCGPDSSYN